MQHAGPQSTQQEVAAFLEDPRTHGGAAVQRIDTHAAMVFLAGERAYKMKRAVRYPYLDFSTVEKRRAACQAELTLNRRTAPSLYLDVTPVVRRADGALGIGGDGAVVDWLVVMRRFATEGLFDRMAERGLLTVETMRDLADAIAAFHKEAEPRRDGGGPEAMRAVVDGNLAELRERPDLFAPERVERLAARSAEALSRMGPLMEQRRRAGFVRHCHGDLHLRNIVLLDDKPTLFDGIEFDESFAVIDVGYDLAFLLMDLEHRGLRELGNAVLNRYLEVAGDLGGLALLPLFLSVRAAVRAKIAATIAALPENREAAEGLEREAAAYLDHALRVLEPPPARLVAVGGLSGTGKSRLARAVAPGLGPVPGAVVLRSDVLRKRMFGVGEAERLPQEAYGPGVTERVYAELAERARAVLAAGQAVIADAVYARPNERAVIEQIAHDAGVRFDGVWLDAPLAVRIARVTRRRGDASDATEEVARRQESYELGPMTWVRVDAGRDAGETLAAMLETLA